MIVNIVLVGATLADNLGGPSLVASTLKAFSRYLPNTTYTLISGSKDEKAEEKLAQDHSLRFVPARYFGNKAVLSALSWRLCGRLVGSRGMKAAMHALTTADAIIDTTGISFADTLGTNSFWRCFEKGRFFLLGRILGKPVIKYTAALGPIRTRWNRMFARLYLGQCCNLILARDEESLQEIRRVGVRTDTLVCPDTGFLFDAAVSPVSKRIYSIAQTRPVIGISVSFQAQRRADSPKSYIKATAELIRHVSQRYSAYVVIIPNQIAGETHDDTIVANEVYAEVPGHHCEVLDMQELRAEEIKGVIQQCDAIVAARYHTLIAALSLGVPVLAVSWHHKYIQALRLFGQEEYLCDIEECRGDKLIRMFDRLWRNKEEVRTAIRLGLPAVQERIDAGARCVCALLQARDQTYQRESASKALDECSEPTC